MSSLRTWLARFKVRESREIKKLITIYNECAEMPVSREVADQISKDIVRTFPKNPYFSKDNLGYYCMFKVLSAYSNLSQVGKARRASRKWKEKASFSDEGSGQLNSTGSSFSSNIKQTRKQVRNSKLRSELIESFWELSFEDSTNYVQGMNFVVGMLSYHLSPELTFAIFFKLMKDYELEENYAPGLPGFREKSLKLNIYFKKHLPKLDKYFVSPKTKFPLHFRNQSSSSLRCLHLS